MSYRQAAMRRFMVPAAIAVVGMVFLAIGGDVMDIIGAGILAIAVTIAISLAFLEVGLSEDRARAREERQRRRDGLA